ncbi:MAG: hypothetical protein J5511_04200 [Bacilli bacterium]|nr:hypothetical protein [Bacilli bacterium]
MEPRKKKETLVQNITYMAIMAAINVVFVLITVLVPFLFFLIVFVLPLTSTIVTLHCKKRYFPIYAVATIGLCMICTMWQIGDTIFYVIPSVISGFLFGFMVEKKVPSFWILTITTLVQIGISYATIPLLNLIAGKDVVVSFATVFGLGEFKYLNYVVPCFIFFIALAQQIIAYMVIKEELPKFGYTLNEPKELPFSLAMAIGAASTLAFAFMFIPNCGPIAYLMSLISLLFVCYAIIYLVLEKSIVIYISLGASLVVSMIVFALIYSMVEEPKGLILVNIFFFIVAIIVLINNYLLKPHKKDTIK